MTMPASMLTAPTALPEDVLRDRFGLPAFRPGQREVIDHLLERGGALAVFPTGGGKSLCYQLPALLLDGVTVVVSPLIALMKDQIDHLRGLGIEAARLDSSLPLDELRQVEQGLRSGTLRLLYVAPERFNNERFLEQLGRAQISLFAVDEAHCISAWGHNFRPDYLKLAETARTLGVPRVLALTATATPAVVEDVCRSFGIAPEAAVVTGFHRPNLFLSAHPTPPSRRDRELIERIRERPPGAGIVYVTLQKTAEAVARTLADAGIPAKAYHAGMDAERRTKVQEWWKASPEAFVVATIAFGMGIDKADVRYVYHYNLPKGLESYSQEIGRAGRDGQPSTVEVMGTLEDVTSLENFAYGDTPDGRSLQSLVREIAGADATFDLNPATAATRHDLRPLVLRTALTYLELDGVIRQGTPFYAGYKVKALRPVYEIVGSFSGERARFVAEVFRRAKAGRVWHTIDFDAYAPDERNRVVRALEHFEAQGWAELQASDLRLRFTRLVREVEVEALAESLEARFVAREAQEIERTRRMVDLVRTDGCITAELLAYFGETMDGGCGHCSWCETGKAAVFPEAARPERIDGALDVRAYDAVCAEQPDALGTARRRARFLCGLTSPALTAAKLGRHPLFGALEGRPFAEVLAWCEGGSGGN
jgi:ATP-dependent DNA helicase RecQ